MKGVKGLGLCDWMNGGCAVERAAWKGVTGKGCILMDLLQAGRMTPRIHLVFRRRPYIL